MAIKINLSNLQRHKSCLEDEKREVQILLNLMDPNSMEPELFAEHLQYLESQKKRIEDRLFALDQILYEFSNIQQSNLEILQKADYLLCNYSSEFERGCTNEYPD